MTKKLFNQVLALLLAVFLPIFCSGTHAEINYLHTDYLGSVVARSDVLGNIANRFHYTPFGELEENGELNNAPAYTSHVYDDDLNLTYMQARYYDPVIGRFYSNDPIGFRDVHSFNRYAYANNNPYRYTDPDGRSPKLIRPLIKSIRNGGDVGKALKETGIEMMDAGATIMDPSSSAVDIAGAIFDLLSPVSTGEISKGSKLLKNQLQGAIGESKTAAKLGDNATGSQVTVVTSTGQRTRADFITADGGVVETKTGGAGLSAGQKQLQQDIANGTPVTPVGNNAAAAGLNPGQPTVLRSYKEDNQ